VVGAACTAGRLLSPPCWLLDALALSREKSRMGRLTPARLGSLVVGSQTVGCADELAEAAG
jgi:hypothetical protein